MAVTKVTGDWKSMTAQGAVQLAAAFSGVRNVKFIVEFNISDDPMARPGLALTASADGVSVPAYWSAHPYETDFFVVDKSADPVSPMIFEVTVKYEYIANPFFQPYTVQFIPQTSQEAIDKAITPLAPNGSPAVVTEVFDKNLCNSSGEPFDPPIQEEFSDVGIIIERNEQAFDLNVMKSYFNTVNSDLFTIQLKQGACTYDGKWGQFVFTHKAVNFLPGTVRCKSIQPEEVQYGLIWYHRVKYEFVHRDDGWLRRLLDQGFRQIVSNEPVAIVDKDGAAMTQPVKLNGNGVQLAPDGTPVFLNFQTKRTKAFSAFNFVWV